MGIMPQLCLFLPVFQDCGEKPVGCLHNRTFWKNKTILSEYGWASEWPRELVRPRFLEPICSFSVSAVLGGTWESVFLKRSWVMLMLLVSDHILRTTIWCQLLFSAKCPQCTPKVICLLCQEGSQCSLDFSPNHQSQGRHKQRNKGKLSFFLRQVICQVRLLVVNVRVGVPSQRVVVTSIRLTGKITAGTKQAGTWVTAAASGKQY